MRLTDAPASVAGWSAAQSGFLVPNTTAPDFASLHPGYGYYYGYYAFTAAVAHMARGQERQDIMDRRPKRPSGKSKEWNAGFDAAMSAFIKLLVKRSILN